MVQQAITATASGRSARFLPALFTANMQNQLYDDISADLMDGTVAYDQDLDGAKMRLDARMKTKRSVRAMADFVAPFLRVIYEDGTQDYEQVGLFALLPAPAEHWPGRSVTPWELGGTFQELAGVDLCWLLDADQSAGPVTMAESANVIADAIADLALGGITRVRIPPSTYTAPKDYTWPPGTSRLQRVNERLMMASYYTIVFDRHGIAMSLPYNDLADVEPAVTYSGASGSRIVPPINDEPDITRLCNRVIVIGTDPAVEPIYAVHENTDPLSPVSPYNLSGDPNRPLWITRREERPELQDQSACDALADELIRSGASYYRTLRIQTLPDPYRQPREIYALDITNPDGVVADGKWRANGWELPLDWSNPVMTHFVGREQPFTVSTP
jgi:hypothetical protein